MAYTNSNVPIHGSSTGSYSNTPHTNSPTLSMSLTVDNFYHNADNRMSMKITNASINANTNNWPYPFDVFAWLVIGNISDYHTVASQTAWSKVRLFSKADSAGTWSAGAYRLASSKTLSVHNPNNLPVHLVIGLMSICTCTANATTDTPVFAVNLSSYIPKIDPYFWRMQHAKDPSVTTGTLGWHLARPFYICKTINGVKGWCSCEDQTKLVYDANGNKI